MNMKLRGNPVSEGLAIGPIFVYRPFEAVVEENYCDEAQIQSKIDKYEETKERAALELREICEKMEQIDPDKAKIFVAHQDILRDEAVNEEIIEGISVNHWNPDWAIQKTFGKFARMLKKAPDPLIRERAADLEDVKARLLRIWHGVPESNLSTLAEPVVVAARDLLPSDTALLDRGKVLAILTEVGGATSHSAIIARSYEIPAVLGVPELLEHVEAGQLAAVDAQNGVIDLEPAAGEVEKFGERQRRYREYAAEVKAFINEEPVTADGVRVDIGLNLGSANESEMAGEPYTDMVGLFRTEFLYMGRTDLPSEDEQFEIYKKVLTAYGSRPVTLRTLDIGGDKELFCLNLPKEDNPFLGNRALRLCFSRTDIFMTQLRASLRAALYGNLWLMLPMVSSIDDIRLAKKLIEEVKAELRAEGTPFASDYKLGIMIEVPSIAIIADLAVQEVDFASIGTNDLCQYLMATDRMNPDVTAYYQTYHPALLRIIKNVTQVFNEHGKPISVCGEMGGDCLSAAALVGLGLRKLSMGFASVAKIKKMLRSLSVSEAEKIAEASINLQTAGQVEAFLRESLF